MELNNIKRMCFIWLGRVGDFIVSTPFIHGMKRRFPTSEIAVLINKAVEDFAQALPYVDRVVVYPKLSNMTNLPGFLYGFLLKKWDVVVDLNPSFSKTSAYLTRVTGADIRVSFDKDNATRFYTHTVKTEPLEHMVKRYGALAEFFNAPFEAYLEFNPPDKFRKAANRRFISLGLDEHKKNIAIHPGNFKKFNQRWPEEKFIELTDRITNTGLFNVVYITGPGEEGKINEISNKCSKKPFVVPTMPLPELAAFFTFFDLLILNPTGTMHLAASVGTPMIVMHTGYSYKCWRPLSSKTIAIKSDNWESSRGITVEEVWEAFSQYFNLKI